MIAVAVIKDNFVENVIVFDDADAANAFDFPSVFGEGAYGVIVNDGVNAGPGFTYVDGIFYPPQNPAPTHDELVALAESEKRQRITNANNIFMAWQTKLLLNRASDEEKAALNAWVDYVDHIQAIDTQLAPDIDWPQEPAIPEGGQ